MKSKIGILLNDQSRMSDFFSTSQVAIYTKEAKWQETDRFILPLINETMPTQAIAIRKNIDSLVEQLGCCHILVGKLIIGMPYYLLTKAGIQVFEAEEITEELFEQIDEDFIKAKLKAESEAASLRESVSKRPVPKDHDGNYFLDLMTLQKADPGITSKKALLPFMCNELYSSLEIVCSHVMPWLEPFMEEHHLEAEINRRNGYYSVLVKHKSCTSD